MSYFNSLVAHLFTFPKQVNPEPVEPVVDNQNLAYITKAKSNSICNNQTQIELL